MRIGTCPCAFCCPPQQSATDRNENIQRDPFRESSRNAGSTKDTNRQDHCEKIGSGITAMRVPTALRIEDASQAHPGKGSSPNGVTNTHGQQESSNDSDRRAVEPVA